MLVSELEDKSICIVGFGREGQDSFLFFRKKFPNKTIGIADQKQLEDLPKQAQELLRGDAHIAVHCGNDYLNALSVYDILVKAPGIRARVVQQFVKKRHILTTQTNIFFANCPGTIVGVTGTKGKSTTCALLHHVLRATGHKAHVVGNIEKPPLQLLLRATKEDIFVYELSSAQLELATQSPHIAVLLNIYPEHLDFHGTMRAYKEAKARITTFQTRDDYLVYNEANAHVASIGVKSKATKVPYRPKKKQENGHVYVAPVEPVFAVAKLFNIPKEKVERAIKKFVPLPHRFERLGTYKGITFYNDSLATVPEASIAALDVLGKQVHTLIAGGFDRGISMEKFAAHILKKKVRIVILFPTTGEAIQQTLENMVKKEPKYTLPGIFLVNSMATAVQLVYNHTPAGTVCLLSPAAASFSVFKDYKERGEEFRKYVTLYAKTKNS